jgi:type III restriction enzyme
MPQVIIENPILNSPYAEPVRHFRFSDEGITSEVAKGRRSSSYFVPVPKARSQTKSQLAFETEWTQERIQDNKFINQVRERVARWRTGGYAGAVTRTTADLLKHWQSTERARRLFFCQIEALETAIYLTEVASKQGDAWLENEIRAANDSANPGLYRIAFKMATGSGKTLVMAMLIAWHTLNKLANPQDARFSGAFLIVTPGITIRDRLRVLYPNDSGNYYRELDIVPSLMREGLGHAKVLITNFHGFKPRERTPAGKITKQILGQDKTGAFTETPDQMVRRVCRQLGTKRNIVVINDEAHHCYRRKPEAIEEKLSGDDRREAQKRDEEARIWISGIEAVQSKIGLRAAYDLSATPFFLRGSGYPEGTLFPWVVSDFSLIDAIESGIVKVPRVPVADDSMTGDQPTYRDLWLRIREDLPKKSRSTEDAVIEPKLPAELEGALQSLYSNYAKYYEKWERNAQARARGLTPPVFIVVCNNTNVSNLVFRHVAGWDKSIKSGDPIPVPGKLPLFSNVQDGRWINRPNTILVDSAQLDSTEGMSPEFKKIAAREIEEFKSEYRIRFPGRDAENLTPEELLREVMNTVGKPGKLGEQIKCVVSVSMLTEGWDANTVTHILGVRAFGTQLLCEQVVGRGLRRMSYVASPHVIDVNGTPVQIESFDTEYAEVYGVPFSFIPSAGSAKDPEAALPPTPVHALEERIACEITFPRISGYRYDLASPTLIAAFGPESQLALSTAAVPTSTENAPIIGESSIHTLDDLKGIRMQEVAFQLAKRVLEKYFCDDDGNIKQWLFPQILAIAKRWLSECVTCKDNTFPQMLMLAEIAHDAADRIYRAIASSEPGTKVLKPIVRPYDPIGSTRYVDFETTRPVYATREDKCHVNYVVADTQSWEQKMAQVLEDMDEVACYVKNQGLEFKIPYTLNAEERQYYPAFIVRLRNGRAEPLNLILEVSGEALKEKAAKVATARTLWVPSVNNHGGFGRWAFLEITDPWDAQNTIRAFLGSASSTGNPARAR